MALLQGFHQVLKRKTVKEYWRKHPWWFKIINVMHHVDGLKKPNNIIVSINAEKDYTPNSIHIYDKNSQKTRERNFLYLINGIYKEKPLQTV